MDTILYKTLLYDFYSELLTDKQQQMFEMYYLDDYSLKEISEHFEISRQGVRDSIKRTEKNLEDYEKKLKLVNKHLLKEDLLKDVKHNILNLIREEKFDNIDLIIDKEFDKLK